MPVTPTHLASTLAAAVTVAMSAAGCADACSSRDADLVRVDRIDDELPWKREVGWLKDGKQHGQWLTFYHGSLSSVDHYEDGVPHGLSVLFDEDGTLVGDDWSVRGEPHGRSRVFAKGGWLVELGWYARNRKTGIWCSWDPDTGELEKIEQYVDGIARQEIENPPGECPLVMGYGKRHRDVANREYSWRYVGPAVRSRLGLP